VKYRHSAQPVFKTAYSSRRSKRAQKKTPFSSETIVSLHPRPQFVLSNQVVRSFQGHQFLVARGRWLEAIRRASKPTDERRSPLNFSKWIRQLHRWLSTVFTLVVIFNGVAVFKHRYANWMGLLAVAALALMFFTGIYLFVLPYVTKWRSRQHAD
jgi:magnesium-transporting ATPase (P-type)